MNLTRRHVMKTASWTGVAVALPARPLSKTLTLSGLGDTTCRKVQGLRVAAAIGMMAGLTGCASHVWCNPNASSEQALPQVQYACKSGRALSDHDTRPDITVNTDPHAMRGVSGGAVNGSGVDPFEFQGCMEKNGYQYVTRQQCDAMAPTRTPERCSLGATCADEAPPPSKDDVIGASPTPGYLWMPGYYVYYAKTGYQWTDGRWAPARPGYRWNAPHWQRMGAKWIFTPGDWERND